MADSSDLLSEVLDKLIEAQVQNAQVTSELKNAVEDNNTELRQIQALLVKVHEHFSNGFRQELKNTISEAVEEIQKDIEKESEEGHAEASTILKSLTDFTDAIKSPKCWISAFLFIASIFGTIAAIVTIILKFLGGP